MKNPFEKSVIVVTGGASGIGQELVRQLAEHDAHLIILDRNTEKGTQLANELKASGLNVKYKHIDMTDVDSVERCFADIETSYGRIDYIFNSAGEFMGGEIRDTPIRSWLPIIENNVFAVINGAHFAYQVMLKQRSGHIINFGSAAGLFPVPAMGIYGSTKFAIVGLSLAMRNEAKNLGVKVSVVCPTVVNTPLYDTAAYNKVNKEKVLKSRNSMQSAEKAAQKIIQGVVRNKATIHTSLSTSMTWALYKITPRLYDMFARKVIQAYRKKLRTQ